MIKTTFKWVGIGAVAVIGFGSAFVAHEWYADKPFRFNSLLDREVVKVAFDNPEALTSLGFLESMGVTSHNAELNDNSEAKMEALFAHFVTVREQINAYDDSELDESEKLSKEIANYLLAQLETGYEFRYHDYPVNQLFGVQSNFPSFMDAQHQINDVESAENYIARLNKADMKFENVLIGLHEREERGILPPTFVVDRVVDEMTSFVETPIDDNILFESLARRTGESELITEQDRERLLADARSAIENVVYPSYQSMIDYFVELRSKTSTDDGLWHLPDGEALYESLLQQYTTTNYSADYIHNVGLSEVARIQGEILEILEAEGFDVSNGFTPAIDALAADDRFYYEDSDAGRAQILEDYQTILDEIDVGIDAAFNIRPEAGMEVVRIPEFKEKTSPGAYYQQPAIDGSRPGRFFANLYDIRATPKYGMRTLAYHEGIPGHHFQIAIAMELEGLPLFRRASPFTAYTEGWALYSEQVAWEMGFQNDPYDNIGRLQAELFRAVRLVVDTGIHQKRWTREEAIEYMRSNTGMALSDVTSEIERYIVMPGQATAYKVGMMKILELREQAQAALGDQFSLAEFHDAVLKNGAVPLDTLERLVQDYIAAKLGS